MRLCKFLGVVVFPLAVPALQTSLWAADPPASKSDPDSRPAPIEAPDFGPLGGTAAGPRDPAPYVRVRGNPSDVNDFFPIPDRYRAGIPGNYIQNTRTDTIFDPYSQNVLKGDYALPESYGLPENVRTFLSPANASSQFFILTLTSDSLFEARRIPTASGTSTRDPNQNIFFGRSESQFVQENLIFSADYFIGDAAYQPRDFEIRATGVFNGNYNHTHELGILSPNVNLGHDRTDDALAPQEFFVEKKLADLSNNYDIISVRAGIQGFNNDFRGFLFNDNEPGVRLFGNYNNNLIQYNLAIFHALEKDTHSGLNTITERNQNIIFANVFHQDFIWPGYTAQLSFAANLDHSGMQYDRDGNLVRPAAIGTTAQKKIDAYYFGWAGDGHIGRFNITHQFYQAFGRESFNEIGGSPQQINAQFAAVELSYDIDYIRLRSSFVYSSGDHHPQNSTATGFDSIFDNPNFFGGGFSYFLRQSIPLTGTNVSLVNRESFIPDLRTSKEQGQANFVNPGILVFNVGMDVDVTQEFTLILNASYLRFDTTAPLQLVLQDNRISRDIGVDLSIGARYRPFLNNNVIITGGISALVPGAGFGDIYTSQTLYSTFLSVTLTY